jgi:membrane protease YdiL (CAAX protease family)
MDAPRGISRERARQHRAEHARARRDVAAVAIVYAGTIATVLALLATEAEESTYLLLESVPFLAIGAVGALLLGKPRATLAAPPRGADMLLALPAAAVMLACGFGWVFLVSTAVGEPAEIAFGVPSLELILAVAILPAVVEEWLCRGVLWTGCERLTKTRTAIAATAMLFAFMHVPAWGLLGVPHRAFAGIVLGMLRARTGSLVPGVLAHFLNNAVAAAATSG